MKTNHYLTAALVPSVALNTVAGYKAVTDYQATTTLCKRLDRFECGMRATVLSLPADVAEPVAVIDPIGELIAQGRKYGTATPPAAQ